VLGGEEVHKWRRLRTAGRVGGLTGMRGSGANTREGGAVHLEGLEGEWYLRTAMQETQPQAAGSSGGASGWGGGAQVEEVEDSR
jgi:hypothetical protein